VLLAGFPAGSFGTNCYVVAAGPGERCLIIDPGQDAVGPLEQLLETHRLTPGAVLLTHGHLDHTWSVVPVCGARDIPAYIHPADRARLADPMIGLSAAFGSMIADMPIGEPDDVRELPDNGRLELAGLDLTVTLAPGHTAGSVTFGSVDGGPDGEPVLFAGDVLFAGSIGRTDLPGGSYEAMLDSLARVILPLPDETLVLSGHGPTTTIGRERATNPYLHEVIARRASGETETPQTKPPKGRGL
jgi:glyoxylase-like metal-dependent hydrolase (beta-lactamase superfamily II)